MNEESRPIDTDKAAPQESPGRNNSKTTSTGDAEKNDTRRKTFEVEGDRVVVTDLDGVSSIWPREEGMTLEDWSEVINQATDRHYDDTKRPDHLPLGYAQSDLIATEVDLTQTQRARRDVLSADLEFECADKHINYGHPFCPSCRPRYLSRASLGRWIAKNPGKPLPEAIDPATVERPAFVSLKDFLAIEDEPAAYRVDGLMPVGGRVVLAAQYKAGKSTLRDNLVRSLADGDPFLGRFGVEPAQVVLIDNELDPRTLRRWLRDQAIEQVGAVRVLSLRGRVGSFDLLDPATRREWAEQLRGADVVIFDCLRPVLDSLGLSEDKDAGRFLVAFDTLLAEAGASEAVVVHHMGHAGERSRGDSRILDWPDATWKIVRESADDPSSSRFFSAFGRDVDVRESRLLYDHETRRLALAGGSRVDADITAAREAIVELLATAVQPMSGRAIEDELIAADHKRQAVRTALKQVVSDHTALTETGPRRSILHYLNPSAPSAPSVRQRTGVECASATVVAHSQPHSEHEQSAETFGALKQEEDNQPCTGCGRPLMFNQPGRDQCAQCDPVGKYLRAAESPTSHDPEEEE